MPGPIRVTQVGAGSTAVIPLDYRSVHFAVGLFADLMSGAANYTVDLTGDDVQAVGFNPANAEWQDHASLADLDASSKGNLAFPATGIRLTVNSGLGTVRLTVIQSGER